MTSEEASRVRAAAVRRILWGVQNGHALDIRAGGAVTSQEALDVVTAELGQWMARRVVKEPA